jgi:hypothetical protein
MGGDGTRCHHVHGHIHCHGRRNMATAMADLVTTATVAATAIVIATAIRTQFSHSLPWLSNLPIIDSQPIHSTITFSQPIIVIRKLSRPPATAYAGNSRGTPKESGVNAHAKSKSNQREFTKRNRNRNKIK